MAPRIVSQGTGAGYTTVPYHWSVLLLLFLKPLLIDLYLTGLGKAGCPVSYVAFLAHMDTSLLSSERERRQSSQGKPVDISFTLKF